MPVQGPVVDAPIVIVTPGDGGAHSPMSFVQRRDTLNRLNRVGVRGTVALNWLNTLDAEYVSMISDRMLAILVGGMWIDPNPPVDPDDPDNPDPGTDPCAYGYGTYGAGPYGGECVEDNLVPSNTLWPSDSLFPAGA